MTDNQSFTKAENHRPPQTAKMIAKEMKKNVLSSVPLYWCGLLYLLILVISLETFSPPTTFFRCQQRSVVVQPAALLRFYLDLNKIPSIWVSIDHHRIYQDLSQVIIVHETVIGLDLSCSCLILIFARPDVCREVLNAHTSIKNLVQIRIIKTRSRCGEM